MIGNPAFMGSNIPVQRVVSYVQERKQNSLLLVAIDGHSAAGKSSLAAALQHALPDVTLVHTDDFYRPMREEERARLDAAGGYQSYYDWQRLEAQVLKPLSIGSVTQYQKYDWQHNCLGGWEELKPEGIIVIEGCYAARPELRHYYNVIILIETPVKQRVQRQQARADASPEWLARWDAAERYYMEQHRPHAYAHLVVAGDVPN
jgi:uridine kinase